MSFKKLAILSALAAFLFTSVSFAKDINLYEQPKDDAKVMGTIDPSKGIVPIYTPKEGGWVKVGSPQNGNVGWVKSAELGAAGSTSTGFSFSQQVENTGAGPKSYVFKFGIPASLSKEQSEALYKQIQEQQAAIQKSIQKIIQSVFTNTDKTGTTEIEVPIMMPVVLVPASSAVPAKTAPAEPAKK